VVLFHFVKKRVETKKLVAGFTFSGAKNVLSMTPRKSFKQISFSRIARLGEKIQGLKISWLIPPK
jgi:hypothetical protein